MNAWNITMELIKIMADIDRLNEEKAKTKLAEKWLMLDADAMRLENQMFDIINVLKEVEIRTADI